MKHLIAIAALFLVTGLSGPASATSDTPLFPAQPTEPRPLGEVTANPHCFNIINTAPYTVHGTFVTNYFINEQGVQTRHRSNFRLSPQDTAEFCSFGPFYEGQRLELILRSLIPIFRCYTMVDQDIRIHGRTKDGGGTETWADCR